MLPFAGAPEDQLIVILLLRLLYNITTEVSLGLSAALSDVGTGV